MFGVSWGWVQGVGVGFDAGGCWVLVAGEPWLGLSGLSGRSENSLEFPLKQRRIYQVSQALDSARESLVGSQIGVELKKGQLWAQRLKHFKVSVRDSMFEATMEFSSDCKFRASDTARPS